MPFYPDSWVWNKTQSYLLLSTKAGNFRTREKKRQNIADLHLADLKVCHEEDNSHIAQSTARSTAVHYVRHSSYNAVLGPNPVSLQDLRCQRKPCRDAAAEKFCKSKF